MLRRLLIPVAVLALLAGCMEGQKQSPLKRADQTKTGQAVRTERDQPPWAEKGTERAPE